MNKTNTEEKALYISGWAILVILAIFAITIKLWPQMYAGIMKDCPFHMLTGLDCPGCGGTRAVISLIRGKVVTSFLYHPLVLYIAIVGGWFMISQTIERLSGKKLAFGMRYHNIYLWIALGIVITNFLVKNVLLLCGIDLLSIIGN